MAKVQSRDVGSFADWLPQAGCSPPPTACLFDWAEQNYSQLFSPSGQDTVIGFLGTYRYYPQTNTSLGLSSTDNHIWYDAGGGRVDVGAYDHWMVASGCATPRDYALTVSKIGSGDGRVISEPAGIDCGGDCDAHYGVGELVTLTAQERSGSSFIGWASEDCEGNTPRCALTMDAAKQVTAHFESSAYPISLVTIPAAGGSVNCHPNPVAHGGHSTCAISKNAGYRIDAVTGCGGNLSDGVYVLENMQGPCTVNTAFSPDVLTASTSLGAGGQITPASVDVAYGGTATFTVLPDSGYRVAEVTGCDGSLVGNNYTTGAITSDCVVTGRFELIPTPVNGRCGASNGTTRTTAPVYLLCAEGDPSEVRGSGPWDWDCHGRNGGYDAWCFAAVESAGSTIMCNDGTRSPTCYTCRAGCCSHHGGCR